MADEKKVPEWKTITDAKARQSAALSEKLRAARLARDAAAPAPEPPKKRGSRRGSSGPL